VRYRGRYEEDGAEGLVDRRLGKSSPKRVPAADARLMLEPYGDRMGGLCRNQSTPSKLQTNGSFRRLREAVPSTVCSDVRHGTAGRKADVGWPVIGAPPPET
jgi:hypothetical protein